MTTRESVARWLANGELVPTFDRGHDEKLLAGGTRRCVYDGTTNLRDNKPTAPAMPVDTDVLVSNLHEQSHGVATIVGGDGGEVFGGGTKQVLRGGRSWRAARTVKARKAVRMARTVRMAHTGNTPASQEPKATFRKIKDATECDDTSQAGGGATGRYIKSTIRNGSHIQTGGECGTSTLRGRDCGDCDCDCDSSPSSPSSPSSTSSARSARSTISDDCTRSSSARSARSNDDKSRHGDNQRGNVRDGDNQRGNVRDGDNQRGNVRDGGDVRDSAGESASYSDGSVSGSGDPSDISSEHGEYSDGGRSPHLYGSRYLDVDMANHRARAADPSGRMYTALLHSDDEGEDARRQFRAASQAHAARALVYRFRRQQRPLPSLHGY